MQFARIGTLRQPKDMAVFDVRFDGLGQRLRATSTGGREDTPWDRYAAIDAVLPHQWFSCCIRLGVKASGCAASGIVLARSFVAVVAAVDDGVGGQAPEIMLPIRATYSLQAGSSTY